MSHFSSFSTRVQHTQPQCTPYNSTAQVKPQEGNCADSSKEGMNNRVQRNVTQEGADVARALQSLAALAPLIARQSAYVVPHSDGISTTSIPSVVPAPLIHQQPLLLQPTALLHPSLYQLGQQQLPYLYHQQATDRNFTLPIQNSGSSGSTPVTICSAGILSKRKMTYNVPLLSGLSTSWHKANDPH